MENLLFYLGFATLMAHELDAMTQAEWRILFILNRLPKAIAEMAFGEFSTPNSDRLPLRKDPIQVPDALGLELAITRSADYGRVISPGHAEERVAPPPGH